MTMAIFQYGFIGAGKMGGALIAGLLNDGQDSIIASRRTNTGPQNGYRLTLDNTEVAQSADTIVLAVEPSSVDEVLQQIRGYDKLLISVVAGKSLREYEEVLGPEARVARCMPNVAVRVGEGATSYVLNANCTEEDERVVQRIFGCSGMVRRIEEAEMNALSALSGSGPAFVGYIVDSMMRAAQAYGVPQHLAKDFMAQTLRGVTGLVRDGASFDQITAEVATKGGITAAGLERAKELQVGTYVGEMVKTAIKKAEDL